MPATTLHSELHIARHTTGHHWLALMLLAAFAVLALNELVVWK